MFEIVVRILALFLMIGMGTMARRVGVLDSNTTTRIAKLVTTIIYPCLVFSTIVSQFTFRSLVSNWWMPAGTILIMSVGFVVGKLVLPLIPCDNVERRRGFLFQCTASNYIFLPLPLVLMLWGEDAVARLVFSTLGSELAVWTIGVLALTGKPLRWRNLRHLLSVPICAILAAAAALAIVAGAEELGIFVPAPDSAIGIVVGTVVSTLGMIGNATIALAMIVAGSRMAELQWHHIRDRLQAWVLVCRLIAVPAATVALLFALPFPSESRRILVVIAAMPSSVASVMLSEVYGADSEFAASCVLITHVVAVATVPFWLQLVA